MLSAHNVGLSDELLLTLITPTYNRTVDGVTGSEGCATLPIITHQGCQVHSDRMTDMGRFYGFVV